MESHSASGQGQDATAGNIIFLSLSHPSKGVFSRKLIDMHWFPAWGHCLFLSLYRLGNQAQYKGDLTHSV